jgi:hypothetical protein
MHHRAFTGFLEDGDAEAIDRRRLGMLVFGWEMNNDYGLLDDVFNRYKDILGHEGTAVVGECIERQLAQSPEPSMKFAIRNLAERFAEFTGTVDDLISVLAQDLTSPYQYLRIATRPVKQTDRPKHLNGSTKVCTHMVWTAIRVRSNTRLSFTSPLNATSKHANLLKTHTLLDHHSTVSNESDESRWQPAPGMLSKKKCSNPFETR